MSTLYIVATPIGNLADITLRALNVLKKVDLILAEDTRQTAKLLNFYKIKKPLQSYHQHSRADKMDYIIRELQQGENLALVSDAGTPGVADPGNVLVQAVYERRDLNIKIVAIPGAAALTAAISVSGLPADKFIFYGFFPKKKGRATLLKALTQEKKTQIFYESPHRLLKTLKALAESLDDKYTLVVARELTKKFEEVKRGTPVEVCAYFKNKGVIKGEIVILLAPKKVKPDS